jgi:hypothetical protein
MGHGYIATILHDKDHHLEVYEDAKNGNLLGIYLRFDSPIFEDEVEDVIKPSPQRHELGNPVLLWVNANVSVMHATYFHASLIIRGTLWSEPESMIKRAVIRDTKGRENEP